MKKIFFVFILMLFTISTFAQNDSINAHKKWHIYTSPLQAIDFLSSPKFTLGTEYIHNKKIGISAEYGIDWIKNYLNSDAKQLIKDQGHLLRFEAKLYNTIWFTKKNRLNDYFGLEYRFIKNYYNAYEEYSNRETSETITDDYSMKKRITIFNLKYGFLINLNRLFYLDVYCGVGVRDRNRKKLYYEFDKNIHYYHEDEPSTPLNSDDVSGDRVIPNLSFGAKIGIKI